MHQEGSPGLLAGLGASLPLLPPSNPSNSLVGPSDGVGFLAFWLAALLKGFHGHPLQGPARGRAFVLQPSRMGRGSLSLCTCHPPPCDGLPPHLCPITAAPVCTWVPISPPSSCFGFFYFHSFLKIQLKKRNQDRIFPRTSK